MYIKRLSQLHLNQNTSFLVPREEDNYDNPRMGNPKQPGPKEPVSFKRPARSYNTDKNFPIKNLNNP
jgi:hypothetical protein